MDNMSEVMEPSQESIEFRRKLDGALDQGTTNRQLAFLEELSLDFPHRITLQGHPNVYDRSSDSFIYVFGVSRSQLDQAALSRIHDTLTRLIRTGDPELSEVKRKEHDMVLYFDAEGTVRHCGLVSGDQVRSKWGLGHVWKHDLWHLPLSYGTVIRYGNKKTMGLALGISRMLTVAATPTPSPN